MAKRKSKRLSNFRQGNFIPRHPEKYLGNIANITYRSSWELRFCEFLDNNPNVLHWASEEISIPYVKPTTGRVHKYYADFFIEIINKQGEVNRELIEIKPHKQTMPSTAKRKKTQLYENITYAINKAKWEAAQQYAEHKGWTFRIVTEHQIFNR